MSAYNTIAFHNDNCDGCRALETPACVTACAREKSATGNPLHSRIKIIEGDAGFETALCRQCGDPKCVMNCPSAALTRDEDTGLIPWNRDKCVNCLLCTVGCAFGGITYNAEVGHVVKCDTCDGDPACVRACPSAALEYMTSSVIFNAQHNREDMFVPGLSACQGCNSELIMRHTMRRVGANAVLAAPPGCIPGMGSVGYNGVTGTKVPVFHPLLTNTASMLAGIKKYYQRIGRDDITVMTLAGDGGTGDVGFQSLSGAAERNEPMLFICVDNEGYMNTGMQASGSTSYGSWTSTTPVGERMKGKRTDGKNLPLIMMMHNCDYVATASLAYLEDYHAKLDKALEASKTGFAYIHIYSPCPSGWRFPSHMTNEVCRKSVESNFSALWEFTADNGLVFTHPTDNPAPLHEYLNLSGKYRHLNEEQLVHIQSKLNQRLATLKQFQHAQPEPPHTQPIGH